MRGSDEAGERENERSIFNMVVPTRVHQESITWSLHMCCHQEPITLAVPLSQPIPVKNYF